MIFLSGQMQIGKMLNMESKQQTFIPYPVTRLAARCSSVVRAFAHGAIDRWIDPLW